MDITKEAKGRRCEIRVPSYCNKNWETTVPCHYRLGAVSGFGLKSPDILIAFGCHACHDVVDGRIRTNYSRDEVRLMHAEGVFRTQVILCSEGKLQEFLSEAERVG